MVNLEARPYPRERLIVQWAKDDFLLLDVHAGTYFALDAVGGRIWELCDGQRTVAEIVAGILAEFDAPTHVVQADVLRLLGELHAEELLVVPA